MSETKKQKTVSVCISAYEMGGHGAEFLRHNFEIFTKQTFRDFDVVVSDQSKDDAVKKVCDEYADRLDIRYFKISEKATASDNTNNAIQNATGKLIKILFLDDFLYSEKSLQNIVDNFDLEKDRWLVTASVHTKDGVNFFRPFHPRYDDTKIIHKNTVSAPSVVTIKNDDPVLFDRPLVWWQDIDFYKRNYARFGPPKILDDINVAIRVHPAQMSNTMATEKRRELEYHYILKKYAVPHRYALALIYKMKKWKRFVKSKIKPT